MATKGICYFGILFPFPLFFCLVLNLPSPPLPWGGEGGLALNLLLLPWDEEAAMAR